MAIDLDFDLQINNLESKLLLEKNIHLSILRLDNIHPVVSGNKWFKLKENIKLAKSNGKNAILTFGGAFSNHLVATAAACAQLNLKSIGIVRGFHAENSENPSLNLCRKLGMQMVFVSREEYRLKAESCYLKDLKKRYPDAWLVPEGGNNQAGREGIKEIANYIPEHIDIIAVPVGTGTTLVGLRNTLPNQMFIYGYANFKNGNYLQKEIENYIHRDKDNWKLEYGFHFGGFAKHSPELLAFMHQFFQEFKIPLDFIYTGKMMFGLMKQIKNNEFPLGTRILAIHTGGLQGNEGISFRFP